MNQTPASVSASKPEATKTIIQPTGTMTFGPGVVKGAVLQGVSRAAAPVTVVTAAAGSSSAIRAIAPQVLAPRLPQSTPGQNIQNIQLPPGTSLTLALPLHVCTVMSIWCTIEIVTAICDLVRSLWCSL